MGLISSCLASLLSVGSMPCFSQQPIDQSAHVKAVVDRIIPTMLAKDGIPGAAVGVVLDNRTYLFYFGVASTESKQPVGPSTLFEIGSVSKTFTATLATLAQIDGSLSLSDKLSTCFPNLEGSPAANITLLELATHTAGAFPLQLPAEVSDRSQLERYLQGLLPKTPPGTTRTYSNITIGTLGLCTAAALHMDFDALLEHRLFPNLMLADTFLNVPDSRVRDYAQGYTLEGKPIRLAGGFLSSEAYGIKTTVADLTRFIQANVDPSLLVGNMSQAVTNTHIGYFRVGAMTQDVVWEQFAQWPSLGALLQANTLTSKTVPASVIEPPASPLNDAWLSKTGSTNGFGTYVAFAPQRKMGIVILANRNFSIDDRVEAGYRLMTQLAKSP